MQLFEKAVALLLDDYDNYLRFERKQDQYSELNELFHSLV